jgi:Flagellar basal body-associated protein
MVDEEQPEAVSDTPVERRSRMPLVIGVVVLLALGAGGYLWQSHRTAHATKTKAAAVDVSKGELYLPLEPAFVVNFRDDESLRYLQVGVTLMSHDPDAINVAKGADPVLRDGLVALFSNQKFSIISDPVGRQKLQEQALATVRKIVQARLGRPGIDALYFTSFVMQ